MANLWIMSDLHQEWGVNAYDPTRHAPAAFDIVVVAGDVDTPGTSAVDRLADWFPGTPVVYVLGNHDYYVPHGADPFTAYQMRLRAQARGVERGVHVLCESSVVLHGVNFTGDTFWTDLRLGTMGQGHAWNTARRGMNDYRHIRRRETGRHHNLRPEDTAAWHRSAVSWLDVATQNNDGPTVVVTHHAPSARSLDNPHMDLRWCYASEHDNLVERSGAALWIHGHLHNAVDYMIGGTRVVSNPRGHGDEQADFVPDLVIEV
jgi:Icc-related predicted phosphoesterase